MKPIKWRNDLRTYGGPNYEDLPVLDGFLDNGQPVKISAWRPSFTDFIRLLLGAPLYLFIISHRQPPIYMTTETRHPGVLLDLSDPPKDA